MKVRIDKCSNPFFWYADRIGQEFDVYSNVNYYNYHTIEPPKGYTTLAFISKSDCTIIDSDKAVAPKVDEEPINAGEWEKVDADMKKNGLTAFNLFPDLKVKYVPNKVYNGAGEEIMTIQYSKHFDKIDQMKATLSLIDAIDKSHKPKIEPLDIERALNSMLAMQSVCSATSIAEPNSRTHKAAIESVESKLQSILAYVRSLENIKKWDTDIYQ